MCAPVSESDILDALNSIGDDKAPGVDGFNAVFYKKAWRIIKHEVIGAFQNFFLTGQLYRAVNCTTILANRIQQVIATVITDTQSGFIPGRKVADNVILAHELVKAYTRKHLLSRCMIKVDLQKAYDTVDWGYLEQVLECLGFPYKFIGWVMECVKTVNYSIIINREPTQPFDTARGLRQGDLMSPFLFVVVMEYLSRCLDDLLMFAKGDPRLVALLHEQFQIFSAASGLQANMSKSVVYYGGVSDAVKHEIQQLLGYSQGELPFRKSLVSWSRMCMPKANYGGLNLTNLKLWNKTTITKTCWELAKKKDTLWIKWVHTHYIKDQQLLEMPIPQQASWMMLGVLPQVSWKSFMCLNSARPKAIFTMWLQQQDRLHTTNRLKKWGLQMDHKCTLCKAIDEDRNHFFAECVYTRELWMRLMLWQQIDCPFLTNWEHLQDWILQYTTGRTPRARMIKMVFTEYIYTIWTERNARVFEKHERKADALAREIACNCNIRATNASLSRLLQQCHFPCT
ncbi:uncharacterized protein LOC132066187 [Lycium ferocissimum]|uniref:uncharacterized protein LOC132066187 n=1 Tax=Lycium ferocissimum TaxID=112874 RepID=UPI0028159ADE|nr:uncharacterized protein LOC132066187 [Lycium ferocissimum]